MSFKLIFVLVLTIVWIYETILSVVGYRSMYNPIPANVAGIYDAVKYKRWQAYHKDKDRLSIAIGAVTYIINLSLILSDAYAWAASLAPAGVYPQLLAVLALTLIVDSVTGCVSSYVNDMVIEQKYGFNRMTLARFVIDRVKELAVMAAVEIALVCLFALIHQALGWWTLVLFSGVLVAVLFLFIFLYPVLSKGFSKFRPLENGELKDQLTALLEKYGYRVKAIEIILASERTSRSNAYFSGLGRTKTIVLYDNLLDVLTIDEIVAVFAHEMGHGLNKDIVRQNSLNVIMFITLAAALFLSVSFPALYADFGFAGLNYGFAFVLLASVLMPFISTAFSLVANRNSRRAEYRADAQAVKEGLGDELIRALKKLADENFADLAPSPLLVALEYSHPPLDLRIEAIRRLQHADQ